MILTAILVNLMIVFFDAPNWYLHAYIEGTRTNLPSQFYNSCMKSTFVKTILFPVPESKEHPVNCQWSIWSQYSECTKSCGGGTQFKSRIKIIPESDGGTCLGEYVVTTNCNIQSCQGKLTMYLQLLMCTWFLKSHVFEL